MLLELQNQGINEQEGILSLRIPVQRFVEMDQISIITLAMMEIWSQEMDVMQLAILNQVGIANMEQEIGMMNDGIGIITQLL